MNKLTDDELIAIAKRVIEIAEDYDVWYNLHEECEDFTDRVAKVLYGKATLG